MLMLQLEQSKRERRTLDLELHLLRRGNQNLSNISAIKNAIHDILDEEIKTVKNTT
jgi:hypothetical protein